MTFPNCRKEINENPKDKGLSLAGIVSSLFPSSSFTECVLHTPKYDVFYVHYLVSIFKTTLSSKYYYSHFKYEVTAMWRVDNLPKVTEQLSDRLRAETKFV